MNGPSIPTKPARLKVYHPSGRTTTFYGMWNLLTELGTGETSLGIFKLDRKSKEIDVRMISLVNVIATVHNPALLWSPRYGPGILNNFVAAYLTRHPEWPRILELTPTKVVPNNDDDDDDGIEGGTPYTVPV